MDICKANHSKPCIRCVPGACGNRKTLGASATPPKGPAKNVIGLKVDVDTEDMDEAIKKAQTLKKLYCDIDTLQQRIIAGQEKINVARTFNINIEVLDKQHNADEFIKGLQETMREYCKKNII